MLDAFFLWRKHFFLGISPSKTHVVRTPKNKFFFKENFRCFCMNFLWQISSKSQIKSIPWLPCPQKKGILAKTYLLRDRILQFLEFKGIARSGVRIPGGGGGCSKDLPVFYRSGVRITRGFFVQRHYLCFLTIWGTYPGIFSKEFRLLFETLFGYKFKAIFQSNFLCFVGGVRIPEGRKCLAHKKSVRKKLLKTIVSVSKLFMKRDG